MAKILSLNVGSPRTVNFRGQKVTTGIFKEPIKGRINLRRLNLDGDKQADLTVHGGVDKAVYSYPAEHYDYWKKHLSRIELPWGMFGENFTTEGLLEDQVNIGNEYQIGSATLAVTQPRMPCYKLGIKFGRMDIIKQFMNSKKTGFYFKVLKEGDVEVGDTIDLIKNDKNNVTVLDIMRVANGEEDIDVMQRAIKIETLAEGWKQEFSDKLARQR
jgi:MOSC domain-containing protein YiiM